MSTLTGSDDLPKIDLTTFFLSISSAAFMGLGAVPPGSDEKDAVVDLKLASQNIDLLELMKEKTQGNLTHEEASLLDRLLYETRMRFLEIQKQESGKSKD